MINWDSERIAEDWKQTVDTFFASASGQRLKTFLLERLQQGAVIFPPTPFLALELTALSHTRVVILGQDPYHEVGQAQGLAFHVPDGIRIPPSLRNIHKELFRDLGIEPPPSGELTGWAQQGVLLLNTVFTVEEGRAASHAKKGWEDLSDALLDALSEDATPKVFLLWGKYAQSKSPRIDTTRHLILQANHPSPLSATRAPIPFIGCGHFSETNRWLEQQGRNPIDWKKFKKI